MNPFWWYVIVIAASMTPGVLAGVYLEIKSRRRSAARRRKWDAEDKERKEKFERYMDSIKRELD